MAGYIAHTYFRCAKTNAMKLLILGATGRTGIHVVHEALQRGDTVHALVRDRNKLPVRSEKLQLFEGSPADPQALADALRGCDAVINVLNISRTSDFPWAPLRTPANFLSTVMSHLVQQCTLQQVQRIVTVTAWGTHETKADIPWWFRWIIDHSNVGYAYRDHERQENSIRASQLDWTIVRPSGLTNAGRNTSFITSTDHTVKPGLTISRKSVACFLLDVLHQHLYSKQAVAVSS